ncbi:MAG TPA: MFS transporter [Feifaniaceae bacterium]|nr:MFS transporter [Feifaniaceae bacterium]
MASLLLVVIYIAFIGLGLPDSLLGAAWPVAHIDLGVPLPLAGIVSIVSAGGTVISSLLSERMIRRFGTGKVTAVSVLLTSAALMGMGFVREFWVVLLLAVPLGVGGGTVDAALNNFVALHYKATHMNWLHCFWGVGATAGPMIMSLYLSDNFWHGAYRTVSLALLGIACLIAFSLPLWKRVGSKDAAAQEGSHAEIVPRRELLKRPGAAFMCIAFFTYCGAEYAAGLWASTYFVNVKGVAPDTAASWASMFFFGITAGRLLSGFAAMKLSDRTLVRIGEAMALLGVLLMLLPLPDALSLAGLLLIGLGCAPIFPSLLDETPQLFGAQHSQGLMGLQLASAYAGGTLMSPLFGWISPVIGLAAWPWYLLAIFILMIFATERTQREAAKALAAEHMPGAAAACPAEGEEA